MAGLARWRVITATMAHKTSSHGDATVTCPSYPGFGCAGGAVVISAGLAGAVAGLAGLGEAVRL